MLTTFEFAEPYCCGSFIRGASFFSRVKDTKVVSLNGRFPFASIKRYTPIAGSIVFVKTFIQRLLSQRRRSQLFETIIGSFAIDMIKRIRRFLTSLHFPDDAVCQEKLMFESYYAIPIINRTCHFIGIALIPPKPLSI